MQNNINKNEPDAFNEMIRQKLENHHLPVEASIWTEIKARLTAGKRRILPFWWWISGEAAVAVIALIFTLLPISESKEPISMSSNSTFRHEQIQSKQVAKLQFHSKTQPIKKAIIPVRLKTQSSIPTSSTTALNNFPAQVSIHDSIERNKAIENTIENSREKEENALTLRTTEKTDSVTKSTRDIPNSLIDRAGNEVLTSTKHKGSWLLAASVGSNGSVPSGNGKYGAVLGDKNIVSAGTNYTSIMTPNNFQNITYTPPLSFGLVIRKDLTNTVGLESGLVYTYLLTTFENNGVQRNDARLHLHYIGVPVNLIVQIWNQPKWEIYMSAGGMIEKGIKSIYVQNQYSTNQTITTTAITDINGVQWSVNGAIGTTYKIQRNVGIFFEPKISYYFDNNQPLSARTDNPVVFGLSAGVRFQFK